MLIDRKGAFIETNYSSVSASLFPFTQIKNTNYPK